MTWTFLAATKQLYEWLSPSVRPSVRLSVTPFFTMFPSSYHHEIFRSCYHWHKWCPCKRFKVRGQRSRSQRSQPNLTVSGPELQFEFTNDDEMMHKAWCCLGEVPYCFSRSSVKFQGHTAKKIVDFDPDWAFPQCNSSLNSPMATKWCTKLEAAWKRCPIVFSGHTSNCKVTRLKKIVDFDLNLVFPDCNSSLNPPMATKWCKK